MKKFPQYDLLFKFFNCFTFPFHLTTIKTDNNRDKPGKKAKKRLSTPFKVKRVNLHYQWYLLMAQTVKNLPAMQEIRVLSLGQEDPLEKGTAAHSSVLAGKLNWQATAHGVAKSQTQLSD